FFGAVIFGAILSSFNSGLHSCSTLFGLDIYRGMMRPDATDEQTVKAGKYFGFVLAVVAMSLAPLIGRADGLFDLMKKLAAVTNVPILAIIFMGILTTGVSTKAAKISLFTGMGLFVVSSFILNNIFFGVEIHWLHVAGMNFAIMCVLMLVLSKTMKGSENRDTVALEPETEGAWGMAKGIGFTVIVLVFLIYTFLHNLGSA
ncbi:MAG: solute:sodium symporter family transporter, partial [Opitutales bacterium]|nr:solute:sodium symporter family transporter [Opitutales bacterium]